MKPNPPEQVSQTELKIAAIAVFRGFYILLMELYAVPMLLSKFRHNTVTSNSKDFFRNLTLVFGWRDLTQIDSFVVALQLITRL